MFSIFRRKKDSPSQPPAQVDSPEFTSGPIESPLLIDFAPRKIRYAGETQGAWFASYIHEAGLLVLDNDGGVQQQLPCPPVDRVVKVGDRLVGIDWQHAWGRRWGYSSAGDREHASGYDAMTGDRLWHKERGLGAMVAGKYALGRDKALPGTPYELFELATGKALWSVTTYEPATADDGTTLYLLEQSGKIRALDIATGHERWAVEPDAPRRNSGYLCRVLLPTEAGVWYVAHPEDEKALLICLDPSSGDVTEEVSFNGWVNNLVQVADGILVAHEFGVALLADRSLTPVIDNLPEATCRSDGSGLVSYSSDRTTLCWADAPTTNVSWCKLGDDWHGLRVDDGVATLSSDTKLLRWPLNYRPKNTTGPVEARLSCPSPDASDFEPAMVSFAGPALVTVQHESRGRLVVKIPNTGLAKGDSVAIGGFVVGPGGSSKPTAIEYRDGSGEQVRRYTGDAQPNDSEATEVGKLVKPKKAGVPKAIKKLVATLTEFGLIDPLSSADLRKLSQRIFPGGELDDSAAARVLQHLHGETGALSRGFLCHDWRFGQETDDVVAEFATCLTKESIEIAQLGQKPDELHVRTTIRGEENDAWADLSEGGLQALASFINRQLEAAGSEVRVHTLATDGDWHAYLIRPTAEASTMSASGLAGIEGVA
ncbi:MAG: PQQ-binding-like beta-propeller repeat protein [Myxococcales bacterium]|nr:PQQ-binding-like beta-propeller repeat protein [Myxococcales bacterium]